MKNFIKRLITSIFLILLGGFILLSQQAWVLPVSLGLIALEIFVCEWPKVACNTALLLIPYLFYPLYFIYALSSEPMGSQLIIIMFLVTPAFDVGAYLLGRLIGRHLLCPPISPNKTWEGVLGGVIAVTGMILLWQVWHGQVVHLNLDLIYLILLISLLAVLGDLFESWLKRRSGLKDMGSILPGHGGILDRIDSILFVSWLFYFGKDWIAKLLL